MVPTSTTATQIEVKFISKDQTIPDNGYVIHSAFTNEGNGGFGELDGIWVAKFEASRNLYYTITSDLINSYAWDTATIYIQEFSGIVDYSKQNINTGDTLNGKGNTGKNGDEACKINDMSTNKYEFTTEYSTHPSEPCTIRGVGTTGERYEIDSYTSNAINSFRTILYITNN